MLVFNLFWWWYTDGWKAFGDDVFLKIRGIADRFSIKTLFLTLFAPFRQIDSGQSLSSSISDRFQAFIARSISRLIGAMTRIVLIITGMLFIFIYSLISFALVIFWPVVPFLPIVGIIISLVGVVL